MSLLAARGFLPGSRRTAEGRLAPTNAEILSEGRTNPKGDAIGIVNQRPAPPDQSKVTL